MTNKIVFGAFAIILGVIPMHDQQGVEQPLDTARIATSLEHRALVNLTAPLSVDDGLRPDEGLNVTKADAISPQPLLGLHYVFGQLGCFGEWGPQFGIPEDIW
jgi:hypothetical protein